MSRVSGPTLSWAKSIVLFVLVVSIALFGWKQGTGRLKNWIEKRAAAKRAVQIAVPKEAPLPAPAVPQDPFLPLSAEEREVLFGKMQFEIPRTLTEDESEILSRRVDLAFESAGGSPLPLWSKEQFKDFLENQQRSRGVYFGRGYERKLESMFDEHYVKAGEAWQGGRIEEARSEFLSALVFPIYRNDLKFHRAVALVMLQPFINDVLGKIHRLNAAVLGAQLSDSIRTIRESYDALFGMIKEKAWDKAYAHAQPLAQEVRAADERAKRMELGYPSIYQQIDADIQKGLARQDEALEPISVGLGSILADLRIKGELLKQNTEESLRAVKARYEETVQAIDDGRIDDALGLLKEITFPPELSEDARKKEAILVKVKVEDAPAAPS
jgi:hypothetical protein